MAAADVLLGFLDADTSPAVLPVEPFDAVRCDAYFAQHFPGPVIERLGERPEFGMMSAEAMEVIASVAQQVAVKTVEGYIAWQGTSSSSAVPRLPAIGSITWLPGGTDIEVGDDLLGEISLDPELHEQGVEGWPAGDITHT